ncbi:MAG: tetratricopeptide repeat protein [Gammaproteobacteria bacterium]|nr:tetratricopeptide repeat protein [Gammaproteobacteria bacterium]
MAEHALEAQFRQLAEDASQDELSAALLVNRLLDPAIDADVLRHRIDELARACPSGVPPWAFMRQRGFSGNWAEPVSLAHSCLADVLRTGHGIPISLGVLLLHVARRRGFDAWGVNFPGHFLTRVGDALIDPVDFRPVTEDECLNGLGEAHGLAEARRLGGAAFPDPFAVATSAMIALRMLNNVKAQLVGGSLWDRALAVVGYQLILLPGNVELRFERAQLWERLGAPDAARQSYAQVARHGPDAKLRSAAEAKLAELGDQGTVWN